ncbi:hypothetical protein BDV95DRAFT_590271 [Massariosphaeria phaeospora]|uniref:Uncharacterized protein n=1 Tax=Massariosphaeria phaeospora TaxID=100035 RepID=A0A7C8MI70_9PLEO|nr:hypothetical protein BDV95DRAFT_590271 [Massariosphaeria phaeospora]
MQTSATPTPSAHKHTPRRRPHAMELPTPITFAANASWTCTTCGVPHRFTNTSFARPLGRLKCPLCSAVANFNLPLTNTNLAILDGNQYSVSVPPGSRDKPLTVFGWVCCSCGRSHQRIPHAIERPATPPPRFRDRILKAYHKTIHGGDFEYDSVTSIHDYGSSLPERKGFRVAFDRPCSCEHATCELCYRFKVVGEGEWIAATGAVGVFPSNRT